MCIWYEREGEKEKNLLLQQQQEIQQIKEVLGLKLNACIEILDHLSVSNIRSEKGGNEPFRVTNKAT
ncbi:hypothetical protein HanXRQr2_Chr16g0773751 [Helianthus annuus]|uniref:Uncharacterized protein n=1 Tax=Helianthus annuus TaxID=4232 RepID=A0A9K3DVC5_HELAN|nr:hypothetical protein HanXRQr2_Chr16g0773751 [Helianthus annuus]KAJ0466006.1 hypothetical protein HanHA300_Chr14g0544361 [Helianthus annuus]KAJ0562411.1 hypothetical protein HanHA89_Chr07g0251071 [Helianthus annuus]KAJ0658028.1 hypothetical protein HanLR1_Chr14g0553191 [Helianthus annuus]KAJ0661703.1 hypothetical protein HanOQP8_Chr14g0551401 [Helianthus annuus]